MPGTQLHKSKEQNNDQDSTGEDLAEGASFWHAFLTPFWGPETIIIFKRNYVEAMFRLSQIQDKPSKSFDQNQPDTTFGQKLVQSTNVPEVKGYMTKPKRTKISEEHNKILGGIESYGFTYCGPRRGRARPQNLSFGPWRGLGEAGRGHHVTRIRL